jgi:hypothetical protein
MLSGVQPGALSTSASRSEDDIVGAGCGQPSAISASMSRVEDICVVAGRMQTGALCISMKYAEDGGASAAGGNPSLSTYSSGVKDGVVGDAVVHHGALSTPMSRAKNVGVAGLPACSMTPSPLSPT